jgi:hypothetical protein
MSGERMIMTWPEGGYKNLLRVAELLADVEIGYLPIANLYKHKE